MDWKSILIAAGSAFIGGLLVVGLVGGNEPASLGGSTDDNWNVGGNLSVTGTSVLTGATTFTGDMTLNGGNGALEITTSNSATSTVDVGCIETTATSTATKIRLLIGSIATTSPSHTGNNSVGHVLWGYGSCPI